MGKVLNHFKKNKNNFMTFTSPSFLKPLGRGKMEHMHVCVSLSFGRLQGHLSQKRQGSRKYRPLRRRMNGCREQPPPCSQFLPTASLGDSQTSSSIIISEFVDKQQDLVSHQQLELSKER